MDTTRSFSRYRNSFLIIYVTKVTDSDKQAGDRPANEVEVTPEMIEAALNVYEENLGEGDSVQDIMARRHVRQIVSSMISAALAQVRS